MSQEYRFFLATATCGFNRATSPPLGGASCWVIPWKLRLKDIARWAFLKMGALGAWDPQKETRPCDSCFCCFLLFFTCREDISKDHPSLKQPSWACLKPHTQVFSSGFFFSKATNPQTPQKRAMLEERATPPTPRFSASSGAEKPSRGTSRI